MAWRNHQDWHPGRRSQGPSTAAGCWFAVVCWCHVQDNISKLSTAEIQKAWNHWTTTCLRTDLFPDSLQAAAVCPLGKFKFLTCSNFQRFIWNCRWVPLMAPAWMIWIWRRIAQFRTESCCFVLRVNKEGIEQTTQVRGLLEEMTKASSEIRRDALTLITKDAIVTFAFLCTLAGSSATSAHQDPTTSHGRWTSGMGKQGGRILIIPHDIYMFNSL